MQGHRRSVMCVSPPLGSDRKRCQSADLSIQLLTECRDGWTDGRARVLYFEYRQIITVVKVPWILLRLVGHFCSCFGPARYICSSFGYVILLTVVRALSKFTAIQGLAGFIHTPAGRLPGATIDAPKSPAIKKEICIAGFIHTPAGRLPGAAIDAPKSPAIKKEICIAGIYTHSSRQTPGSDYRCVKVTSDREGNMYSGIHTHSSRHTTGNAYRHAKLTGDREGIYMAGFIHTPASIFPGETMDAPKLPAIEKEIKNDPRVHKFFELLNSCTAKAWLRGKESIPPADVDVDELTLVV
ncbi:hypothetical protein GWK47_012975 [Chionoecetes opilio]|uniref:Uncharacterized protein n=1 Tax=Chionoecetes opilio TaxID=41210 RepID=A0A8J4Y0Z5_CHIOP|nr:hypothetical protein GWK47_012975 [Chionoecetes opilio]